ncbi:MAG: polysaccharide pyruvyl transferase family protein [Lachnospiraceae bacterium]|nr:polysaccharide pyruvyl transferase family protein [Lachnospiraceae bacterium]
MKIGTITYHGAYNYGSVLQAYALQEFVIQLGEQHGVDIDYSIINYRPRCQKEIYWQVYPPVTKTNIIKSLMRMPYARQLKRKAVEYEQFLSEHLNLTEEVQENDLNRFSDEFDWYISGSDQIFNIRSKDFTFSNLLNFTNSPHKISYAASLGPLQIDWSQYDKEKYISFIQEFSHISVREQRSKDMLDKLLGKDVCSVHIDPTLLLDANEWRKVQSGKDYKDGQYILIYCLEPTKKHMFIAEQLSKTLDLPIVCTGYRCKYDYFNSFVKLYDAGPADFLALIDHAAMVLTSSFHGTAFSVIYNKPFWVIDGMEDNRIRDLLIMTGLSGNSITLESLPNFKKEQPLRMSSDGTSQIIERERVRSSEYLKNALEL